ncbi:PAS domain S-box protein [uncultured Sunxiuqinia sp.]|uniref:PAS domain S-box protein n=1 Tax=uncultured Sunxiuqinia sp. TaxID=1573825 RepID=UPI002AA5F264|nr:PAS domain S-box protein [uncultured Sunxiuqinia sp.]
MEKKEIQKATEAESSLVPAENIQVLPVVGIGASAGGLEALERFFVNIPSNTGAAFVIIQHLDPNHKSILADLIKRYTKMEVLQIIDGVEVMPDTVYIIPPGSDVSLKNNKLILSSQPRPRTLRLPIDSFLKSLAHDKKDRAIGIILSGTGTDGTLGVRAIKSGNGIVFVQTPENAKYDGMPVSAISTGLADHILDADKMSEKLLNYLSYVTDETGNIPIPEEYSNNILTNIFNLLSTKTGHDFSYYKPNTIIRRIERRMKIAHVTKIEDYIAVLQKDATELETLFHDFLIGVTNFFRDRDAFEKLSSEIIPELFSKIKKGVPIRIWIPGCSTGEEAYSIAILFEEFMDTHSLNGYKVQIFATDIDRNALDKARQAVYPENIAADVPEQYLQKYFTLEDKVYVVNKPLRDIIVFAEQSVVKDPPFSKVDLVSCRNLLIYMSNELQERAISTFHYALNSRGYLFLGSSETLGKNRDIFTTKDKKWKLYQKNDVVPKRDYVSGLPSFAPAVKDKGKIEKVSAPEDKMTLKSITENKIIEHFTPAAVLVNNKQDILFFKGKTSAYLEPVQGVANMNVVEMAKPGIRVKLRVALSKAIRENKAVVEEKLHLKTDNTYKFINIHIQPVKPKSEESNLFLIVFEDITETEMFLSDDMHDFSNKDVNYIETLELELKQTKEYLQSVIEQSETTNEELKAANEELQSSNEELQSTNEELETSKEELQSINEELITVNTEHQNKIAELSDLNNDVNNLLTNTEIATIFLDVDLKIKKFTPKVTEFINLIAGDINRPIEDFVTKLNYPDFKEDIEHVVNTLNTVEKEIDSTQKSYICRMMPYRTLDNVVTGVVITFVDVTRLKAAEKELIQAKEHAEENEIRLILAQDLNNAGTWDWNIETNSFYWSDEFLKLFGMSKETEAGFDAWHKVIHPDDLELASKKIEESLKNNTELISNYRIILPNGDIRWIKSAGSTIYENDKPRRMIGLCFDITDVKQAEADLISAKDRIETSEKKYRQLFQNSPDSVIVHDLEMNIIDVNDRATAEFGYSREEFLQKKVFDLHPKEELPNSEDVLDTMKKKESLLVETKFHRKDGSLFLAEATPCKYLLEGKEIIQVVIRNITKLKEAETKMIQAKEKAEKSEKYLRDIINNIGDPIFVKDDKSRLLMVNSAFCEIFGISEVDVIGKTLAEDVALEEQAGFLKIDKQVIATGQENITEESLTVRGGEMKTISTRKTRFIDAKGNKYLIGVIRDITKRKQAELELTNAKEQAEKSEQSLLKNEARLKEVNATKDKFFSIIAHDLKSPFNSIIGFSEMLNRNALTYSPEKVQKLSGVVYQSSTLAFKLLDNLLEWSRLQSGAIEPDYVKVKPSDLIDEVNLIKQPIANSKNIRLQSVINADDLILADKEMVKTVLRNLISNALKFTHPEGIVKIETQSSGNDMLFMVSDTGIGIESKHLDKVFELDNKLSGTGTANEKGTGLGLILCAEFIKLLHGKIWVESELGVGSRFYFTIPKTERAYEK